MTEPIPMPFGGRDIPHIVIEVNQVCNMSCEACYKNRRDYTKPIQTLKDEVDYAMSQRNLDMITLAGGEPTLHPDLVEIIRYIHDRGIKVSILSNGLKLTEDILQKYKAAGLTRVMLHVDSLQDRPDAIDGASERDLNPLREQILRNAARNGIRGGLALTLYQRNKDELKDVLDFVFSSRWVSLVLVALCKSFWPIVQKYGPKKGEIPFDDKHLKDEEVTTTEVIEIMRRDFNILPAHYIASNLSDDEKRWLFYLTFAITKNQNGYEMLNLSSRYRKTIMTANHLQKVLKRRYKFDMVPNRYEAILVCLLYGILSMDRANLRETMRFLSGLLGRNRDIQSKVIVVQQPPNLTADGEIEHCKDCPDATVRNGKIMPLCLADIMSPVL